MGINEDTNFLKKRIMELEKQLDNLRLSRRVLMDLLEQTEKEKNILSSQLQKKNKRLNRYRRLNFNKLYKNDFELYQIKDYIKE